MRSAAAAGLTSFLSCFLSSTPNHNNAAPSSRAAAESSGRNRRSSSASETRDAWVLMFIAANSGDLDRESFLVKVFSGKQVVTETLPPAAK